MCLSPLPSNESACAQRQWRTLRPDCSLFLYPVVSPPPSFSPFTDICSFRRSTLVLRFPFLFRTWWPARRPSLFAKCSFFCRTAALVGEESSSQTSHVFADFPFGSKPQSPRYGGFPFPSFDLGPPRGFFIASESVPTLTSPYVPPFNAATSFLSLLSRPNAPGRPSSPKSVLMVSSEFSVSAAPVYSLFSLRTVTPPHDHCYGTRSASPFATSFPFASSRRHRTVS